jgi:hypothetical protein
VISLTMDWKPNDIKLKNSIPDEKLPSPGKKRADNT